MNKIKFIFSTSIIGLSLFCSQSLAFSQSNQQKNANLGNNQNNESKINSTEVKITPNLFPDSYSELDDNSINTENIEKDGIEKVIFEAKKKYYQAIDYKRRKDTTNAILYFDKALTQLNTLISIPDIDRNDRFYDLTQQIIEEYETLVTRLDDFNENTPLFVIRDKFFKDLEKTNLPITTGIEIKSANKDNENKKVSNHNVLCQPDLITIPLDQNEYVLKNIEYLTQTKARRFFTKWLERSSRYLPMMKQIAKEEGMPEEIVYLSMIESGLDPNAVSKASAVGLWQFMRPTGIDYNLNAQGSKWIDERRDPEKSTRAAMKYLNDLYNMFGDWHLALASYNCGQGRVAKVIKKSNKKNPTYWDIRDLLPLETRFYVSHYIATATIAMNPECYGFSFDSLNFQSKYEFDTFELKEPVNLEAIAKCLDADINLVKAYNPELIKSITPLDLKSYKLKIPKNSFDNFAAKFSVLTDEEKRPWISYEIGNKETLASISRKFKVSEEDILSINDFSSKSKLKRGHEVRLPITLEKYNEVVNQEQTNSEYPLDGNSDVFHIVKKGESLTSIARKYGITISEIKALNGISEKNENVLLGQQLIIAHKDRDNSIFTNVNSVSRAKINKKETESDNNSTNNSTNSKTLTHKVKKGETLARIADLYGVTIADIKKSNKIRKDKVLLGQEIIIETTDKNSNVADLKERKSQSKLTTSNSTTIHKVQKGETLGMIAAQYGVTENDIKSLNSDVIEGNTIFSGTNLKIVSNESKGAANSQNNKVNKLPNYYKVESGETLSSIARKFGVSIPKLLEKNKGLNENKIKVGQKIRIN